jgi:hypothetical protein
MLALLILAFAWAIYAWNSIDVEMRLRGHDTRNSLSLGIGCGLMALMFYSSRHGV